MRDAQETLKASFDALRLIDCMAFDVSDYAKAFDMVGNTRMADTLDAWSEELRTSAKQLREAISEDVNRRAAESTQSSADMVRAAIAVAMTGESD
jgi:hypothetical protein